MTIAMLLLFASGQLQIWHLFVAQALSGAFEAFQLPAYIAATSLLVPKAHYARASGMRSIAESGSQIAGPVAAGALLTFIHVEGIMLLDVATFLVAMVTLWWVRIPKLGDLSAHVSTGTVTTVGEPGKPTIPTIWQDVRLGFDYIVQRRGLLGLLLIFVGINFFAALTYFAVLPALVLARTGSDEQALALVEAALGLGGVVGGVVLSLWGGPQRKIHMVLVATAVSFWAGDMLFATGRTTTAWVIGAFAAAFFVPFIMGGNRAIWQAKVPLAIQGRVFSVQAMLQTATMPLGYLVAGPLADWVFEPAMVVNGRLAPTFGWLVGTGPGAGMGLMFLGTAVCGTLMSLSEYLFTAVRQVETDLPDAV